jgi:UDP-2,3-diacylglucosamine pyrophosphatase LpxH
MNRRSVELVVISDVHLGTFGCHANELIQYLRSILPKTLVLNGDIIDIWQFSKRYFPQSHMQVIKEIFSLLSLGTRVVYITGNHDEIMRRYSDLTIGQLELTDKLILELDGKITWIFHGDVFDRTTRGSAKVIAKLGGYGYDLLILLNRAINHVMSMLGKEKMSLSKQVKNGVKKAVSWINNFEQTAAELAIENKYDYVICGHIHQPQQREITTEKGCVTYLNSGDWIENLTSLEYEAGKWTIYHYDENEMPMVEKRTKVVPLSKVLSVENLVSQQIAFSATAKR